MARSFARRLRRLERSTLLVWLAAIWLAVICVFAVAETAWYWGFAATLGEWQYRQFHQHRPELTVLLLIAILGLPSFLILTRRPFLPSRRRARRLGVWGVLERGLQRERTFLALLAIGFGLTMVAALGIYLWGAQLVNVDGHPQIVRTGDPGIPHLGNVTISAQPDYRRLATLRQRTPFLPEITHFVPIAAPGSGGDVRYFLQLSPEIASMQDTRRRPARFTGLLRRNALPGAIERLFAYDGYRPAPSYYVLFTDRSKVRLPYNILATHLLIAAAVIAIFMLIQLFRLRGAVRRRNLLASR